MLVEEVTDNGAALGVGRPDEAVRAKERVSGRGPDTCVEIHLGGEPVTASGKRVQGFTGGNSRHVSKFSYSSWDSSGCSIISSSPIALVMASPAARACTIARAWTSA
jgi:hypothetical protein